MTAVIQDSARSFLVAWDRYTVNGGIGRFVNCARMFERFGHTFEFVSITGELGSEWDYLKGRIRTMEQVVDKQWDAVMVPGAGLAPDHVPLLDQFRGVQFGTRIQHVLNDRSIEPRCIGINEVFVPHVVVFNNSHWDSFVNLRADVFHVLPGAVNTELHRPAPFKKFPRDTTRWCIGGYGRKNPEPLLEAVSMLPENFHLHLYGVSRCEGATASALEAEGRLSCWGPLFDEELVAFYDSMDAVVTTETHAGWCNTAAEAMAHGLPCIVSPAGTIDFSAHGNNAIKLNAVEPNEIASALLRVACDPSLAEILGRNAAESMRRYSWADYCAKLLRLAERPGWPHYFREPSLGLFGKRSMEGRLDGLEPLREHARGETVLDVGAAEGLVALHFMKEFLSDRVDGFEKDLGRVSFGNRILGQLGVDRARLYPADLSSWDEFKRSAARNLRESYGGVLFLGVYHHLPRETRKQVLQQLCRRAEKWIAVRTPPEYYASENVETTVCDQGFQLIRKIDQQKTNEAGTLCIFERVEGNAASASPG